jgi:hypothetical protein
MKVGDQLEVLVIEGGGDNIETHLKEIMWDGMNTIHLAQHVDQ